MRQVHTHVCCRELTAEIMCNGIHMCMYVVVNGLLRLHVMVVHVYTSSGSRMDKLVGAH